MESKEVSAFLEAVRERAPLIHNITNTVVSNFNANGLLALGASPVMANAVEEAADMALNSDALVLNIGTLEASQVEAMHLAGKAANEKGIPVVLDPVGAGATSYRTQTVHELLKDIKISILRGNAAEIAAVAGLQSQIKGVDSAVDNKDTVRIALEAFQALQVPVAVTGPKDAITDGDTIYTVENGHSMLTRITGSGCLSSAIIAAFLTVSPNTLEGAAAALGFYGVSAERAEGYASMQGPGTFQVELLNALYHVGEMEMKQQINIYKEVRTEGE
ncbi:hydroxyethylthiazole kinase [Alteribacillus iranensis]|uniref:Hydroxyethylthiazole kinase n=1 Tax=Alteribacillus iranensis TaxID=930128 RepID=A0A1I2DFZ3_9BACI|nr:hydroxyethylthiazole kinase [Alteribacillus iranensis]SFE79456.1 hydroxyethylthiazole kinase [Alteribacillus iranensis]